MRNKAAALLLTALLCLTLCGCAPKLQEGEVYEKTFTPAHTTSMMMPYTISNGKTIIIVMVPVCRHYPDQDEICIKAVQDDEWITATYYVTEEVYSTVDVGDYFRYEKDRDRTQPVYYDEKGGKTDER